MDFLDFWPFLFIISSFQTRFLFPEKPLNTVIQKIDKGFRGIYVRERDKSRKTCRFKRARLFFLPFFSNLFDFQCCYCIHPFLFISIDMNYDYIFFFHIYSISRLNPYCFSFFLFLRLSSLNKETSFATV